MRKITRLTRKGFRLCIEHVAQIGRLAMRDQRDRELVGEVGAFDDQRFEPHGAIIDPGAKEAALDDEIVGVGDAAACEDRHQESGKSLEPHANAPEYRAQDSVFVRPQPARAGRENRIA